MRLTCLALALPMLAAPCTVRAQNSSAGPLAGAPVAILVDGGLGAGNDGQTRVHRNGFGGAPVALPAAIASPDLKAILAPFGGNAGIDYDDLSLGRDDVNFSSGYVDLPATNWSVLHFSLRQGAQGIAGSVIRAEALNGNVGAALFSWILRPDPTVGGPLPPQVVGRTERSHAAAELGLSSTNADVDGLDVPLMLGREQAGLLGTEPGFVPLVGTTTIYFTVSTASLAVVPLGWWGNYAPSGAHILETHRNATGGGWTYPQVFRTSMSLSLPISADIDALAYDEVRNKLLFSLVGGTMDQLLFADLSTDSAIPEPAKTSDGQPISQQIGKAQNDDVDAVCTLDPALFTQTGGPALPPFGVDDFGSSCGSLRPGQLGTPTIAASAFRRYEAGVIRYDSWMIGWPPQAGVATGFAVPFVTLQGSPTLYLAGPIQVRDPNAAFAGDPRAASVVVPASLALTNYSLTFRWLAIDAASGEFAEAWPVQVFL